MLAVSLAAPAAQADPTYQTMNASGGIYWRAAPDWNTAVAQSGNGFYPGTVVAVHCYAPGTAVPGSSNTMWEQATVVAGPGHGSGWINEHFLNDGVGINQPSPGVPSCTAGPAQPPATPSGDQQAANVANWASAHAGATYATGGERQLLRQVGADWGAPSWDGPTGEWSGDCYRFAFLAWYANGIKPILAGTARAAGDAYQRAGRMHGGVPPVGAMVFYTWSNAGHVGISLGNGQVMSTHGVDGQGLAISARPYNQMGLPYRGWVDPRH